MCHSASESCRSDFAVCQQEQRCSYIRRGCRGALGGAWGPFHSPPQLENPQDLSFGGSIPSWGLWKRRVLPLQAKPELKVSQERRCWRLSRDFGPGCAQPCAGLQNEPCRALLVQLFGCSGSWCCLDSVSQALLHEHPAARRAGRVPRSF